MVFLKDSRSNILLLYFIVIVSIKFALLTAATIHVNCFILGCASFMYVSAID